MAQGTPAELHKSDLAEVRQFMGGLADGPVAFHYPAPDYAQDLLEGRVMSASGRFAGRSPGCAASAA